MFGRHPRLPIDTLIKEDHTEQEINEFARKLRERLRDAYNMASEANDKARQNQKRLYDRNTRGIMPQIGDLVLVRFGLCCLMTPGLSKDIRCHV